MKIEVLDTHYLRDRFAAVFLLENQGRYGLIEANTGKAVPGILETLKHRKVPLDKIEFLGITHVHLDHAAGTSALLEHLPNAKVYCHPKTARHLKSPEKIIKGATAVYGQARFDELYGDIAPVPADRVQELEDATSIPMLGDILVFLHTAGHARHHGIFYFAEAETAFTGDTFGIHYPALQTHGLFIFPSTSPTDFDPVLAIQSVDRIAGLPLKAIYPTHYSAVKAAQIPEAARQLKHHLQESKNLLENLLVGLLKDEIPAVQDALERYYSDFLTNLGFTSKDLNSALEYLQLDLEINAQGILYSAARLKENAAKA